jgi:hypothetical protein
MLINVENQWVRMRNQEAQVLLQFLDHPSTDNGKYQTLIRTKMLLISVGTQVDAVASDAAHHRAKSPLACSFPLANVVTVTTADSLTFFRIRLGLLQMGVVDLCKDVLTDVVLDRMKNRKLILK